MKKLLKALCLIIVMIAIFGGCAKDSSKTEIEDDTTKEKSNEEVQNDSFEADENDHQDEKVESETKDSDNMNWSDFHIGFSQDWNYIEWTQAMRDDIEAACKEYGIKLTVTDAGNSGEKQISDIEDLITLNVDAILISTYHADTIGNATNSAIELGIPVIVLSSEIPGVKPTSLISADAVATGEACARYVEEKFPDGGNIIQITGKEGSVVNQNRGIGFRNVIDQNDKFTVLEEMSCNYERSLALTTMEDLIHVHGDNIDIVYTHNDDMALGVIQALKDAGYDVNVDNGVFVISAADAIYEEVLDSIEAGEMISAKYPTFGREGVESAVKLFSGEDIEENQVADSPIVTRENVDEFRN